MATPENSPTAGKNAPAHTGARKARWSLKKSLGIIAGAVAAAFIVLFIVISVATGEPVRVSNDLVTNIQANNEPAAYALMSTAAQSATSEPEFRAILNRISPILSGKPDMQSKEIKGETGTAATAKVIYKIHGSDGVNYKLTVNLAKDSGSWKVQNFESVKD